MDKHILQDCLDRIERGEKLEQVLARYPAQRDELGRLIVLATSVQRATPKMSEAPKPRARYEGQDSIRANESARPVFTRQTWGLRIMLAIIIAIVFGGAMIVAVETAPGKPLFPARAAFNETRARIITEPSAAIQLHLENAQARVDDVRALQDQRALNDAPIFLVVGATENLMVALENNPGSADRATIERAMQLVQNVRALLRDLMQTAPVERTRRNAETLYQLSESWTLLLNRLIGQ